MEGRSGERSPKCYRARAPSGALTGAAGSFRAFRRHACLEGQAPYMLPLLERRCVLAIALIL
jgi:hypothetical protein